MKKFKIWLLLFVFVFSFAGVFFSSVPVASAYTLDYYTLRPASDYYSYNWTGGGFDRIYIKVQDTTGTIPIHSASSYRYWVEYTIVDTDTSEILLSMNGRAGYITPTPDDLLVIGTSVFMFSVPYVNSTSYSLLLGRNITITMNSFTGVPNLNGFTFSNSVVIKIVNFQTSGLIEFVPVVDLNFLSLDCDSDILHLSASSNGAVVSLFSADVDGVNVSGYYDNSTGFFDVYLPAGLTSGTHTLSYFGILEFNGENYPYDSTFDFDYTCEGSPPPEESPPEAGQFKIVYPVSKQVFDNGTGSITVQVQYGGDVNVDFAGYGVKLKLENLAGTEWSSYLTSPVVADGFSTWSVSMPINDDNSYTLNAYLQSSDTWLASVVRFDFVFFEVGGGSIPEDVVSFLQRWWDMFKEWFVGVMNYLFVPTAEQIQSLLPTSASTDFGLNPFTPSMFPSPVYAVDIPLSATYSVSLSVEGVPQLWVNVMRAFSQIFISLSLVYFLIKGF